RRPRFLSAVADVLTVDCEMGTILLDDTGNGSEIQKVAGCVDADAPTDIELCFGERLRALVFHYLYARSVANYLFAGGNFADPAHIEPHARIELEGVAA